MRRLIWVASAAVLVLGIAALALVIVMRPPVGPEPISTEFTLPGVTVIDPLRSRRSGATLRVRGGEIVSIDEGGGEIVGTVFDEFAGHIVLPGIIDMHTHLPSDTPLALTRYFGLLQLVHGVTSLREAGDMDGTTLAAARRIHEEEGAAGPRIFGCGPLVGWANPRRANSVIIEAPDTASAIVDRLADEGARCIKLYDGLDVARIRALVAAARARGISAMGHVPFGLRYEEALVPDTQHLMGVQRAGDIERGDHIVFRIVDWRKVDEVRMDQVVQATVENGFVHTPTLVSTYQLRHFADYPAARRDRVVRLLPRLFRDVAWSPTEGIPFYRGLEAADHAMIRDAHEKKLKMVGKLNRAGVVLYVGTDTQQPFVVPGAAAHLEMQLFQQAGIEPERVWANATWRSGRALGLPELGHAVAGAPADLLIFREDPTADLQLLNSLEAVVSAGRLYRREDLEAAIAAFQRHYEGAVVDALSVAVARRLLRKVLQQTH